MTLRRRRPSEDVEDSEPTRVQVVEDLDEEAEPAVPGGRRRAATGRSRGAAAVTGAADADVPAVHDGGGEDARGGDADHDGLPGAHDGDAADGAHGASTRAGAARRRLRGVRAATRTAPARTAPDRARPRGGKQPLYPRLLRLRHISPNAWQRAALGEGAIAVGVLLAMADLATAWGIVVLPVVVALIVKAHDALQGLLDPRDDPREDAARAAAGLRRDDAAAPPTG